LKANLQRFPEAPRATGAALQVVQLGPQDYQRCEQFVARHPEGIIYQHPLWLRVLQQGFGCEPVCLGCQDGEGRLRGVLPLCESKGLFSKLTLTSLPHTPEAGPLVADGDALSALLGAAVELAQARGCRLQLRPARPLEAQVSGLIATQSLTKYLLGLPATPEQMRFGGARNRGRIRNMVNQARRFGVTVRPAEHEQELRAWYRLYVETMRWHGALAFPYAFLEAVWELLRPRGLAWLLLAERGQGPAGVLLAGSLFLGFNRTVFYAKNGCRRDALNLHPNDAIQWEAIHAACAAGYSFYNLGEVQDDKTGLAKFKEKWGAEPQSLYRYHYPEVSDFKRAAEQNNPAWRMASLAWRRMPHAAVSALSRFIYRHI
jgi:hypothetical protein